MRVLIVNTSEQTGGAAVAARRLMEALNNSGVKAKMLVRDKQTSHISVCQLPKTHRHGFNFLWERLLIFLHLRGSRRNLFAIDIANTGSDITRLPEFREADIIHLHWINQGMLSLADLRHILDAGKPVVWTMHDIWPATAICHLSLSCRRFTQVCGACPYLSSHRDNDLAAHVWRRKQRLYQHHAITFVACSHWLQTEAEASALLKGQRVLNIPNPIDTRVFAPRNKVEARRRLGLPTGKRLVLFASQRATNAYKGMDYLAEALRRLVEAHPALHDNTALLVLGGHAEEVVATMPIESIALGYVSHTARLVDVYNAADIFVLPSLSENLPNTIMEAMACGVPCLGFDVGGIPEEIDHLANGYVARYKDAADLAEGLRWLLTEAHLDVLAAHAVSKVARLYSQHAVAMRYVEVYNGLLGKEYLEI